MRRAFVALALALSLAGCGADAQSSERGAPLPGETAEAYVQRIRDYCHSPENEGWYEVCFRSSIGGAIERGWLAPSYGS